MPRLLTLLMLPGAAVHVTSGVVPRQKVRALARLVRGRASSGSRPRIRVGPVLVDPGEVRLPLVAALGERQTLTTPRGAARAGATTRSSPPPSRPCCPTAPSVLREGWIRVTPAEDEGGAE